MISLHQILRHMLSNLGLLVGCNLNLFPHYLNKSPHLSVPIFSLALKEYY